MGDYKKGDRVTVVLFNGDEHKATVARDQASSVVWVMFDGETRERWFYEDSLTACAD